MRISFIKNYNYNNGSINKKPSFGRKPYAEEMKVYTASINEGLEILGKQIDLILHNASAPAIKSENTGIGSLLSQTVKKKLFPFLKQHSFSHIQQEPNNFRKAFDNSPYSPEADTKNIFMIPLEKLASDEYGNILSKESFARIVNNNPNPDRVNYPYVRKNYDDALREAFQNSKKNTDLTREFNKYKSEKEAQLEQSAIFHLLSKENNYKNWQDWPEIDRTLYVNSETASSKARIAELKDKYKDEYDLYLFEQMILDRECTNLNNYSKKIGISIIGDFPVASSAVEEWVNQKLFLPDVALGSPPDCFTPDGQRWGFKYYNPDEIFNKDGSLGKAGKILKRKYESYFESFPGGIRIDHIIGLIDPFIYNIKSSKMTPLNSGRIYSIPNGPYQKHGDEEYANILSKIVLPAGKRYGVDKSSIICEGPTGSEDCGVVTDPVKIVINKLNLGGIAVTQYGYRGSQISPNSTIMLGSHDNQSFLEFIENLFRQKKPEEFLPKTQFLAQDTIKKDPTQKEWDDYLNLIRNDKKAFLTASFTELFASPAKRIQIFFTDLFGIAKTYNRPGTIEGNWELRLGENFEEQYYKAVQEGKAPNLAKAIANAMKHRGIDKDNPELMKNLETSAKILDE